MAYNQNNKGGYQKREEKEFDEEVIQIDRVTKVVKGGRRLRFRATVAIGDRKGRVGIGLGKSNEVTGAIQKGIAKAKKCLIKVILNGSTIPHDVKIKHKSAHILLLPASPGTGLIAGGTIRKVLELAGVKDILSKSFGTTNKVNNTKAIYLALKSLRQTPAMLRKPQPQPVVKQTEAKAEVRPKKEGKPEQPTVKPTKKS
ncbi:MAG: 30S ribosomal protein S5 [Candidatus Peregrinibacteria bacterium]